MILVASHVNYHQAWGALRQSLLDAHVPMSEVILVIAGADKEVCIMEKEDKETVIAVPYNFYEMTAIYGLHRFIDHPRLKADNYLLLHDTCAVTADFYPKYKAYLQTMKTKRLDVYHALKDMRLNIVALSYDFIKTYGHHYALDGDKPMAWDAEHGGKYSFRSFVPADKVGSDENVLSYGRGQDIYGSKLIRHPVLMETVGVIKFVANNDAEVNPPWQERHHP